MKKEYITPNITLIKIDEVPLLVGSPSRPKSDMEVFGRLSDDEQLSKGFNPFPEEDFEYNFDFDFE